MTRRVTVRHPAGVIDLGDGLEVDVQLRRDALGSLLHARAPVMAAVPEPDGTEAFPSGVARRQVGTAVLITWRTLHDGSAVDLEFDVDLDG